MGWTGGLGLVVKGGLDWRVSLVVKDGFDWRAWSSCERCVGLEGLV